MELALRAEETLEAVDFLSSSLALMLGRLRWLEMELAVGGRRTVEVGGRVGGLLRPPGARALAVVGLAVVEVAAGRRVPVAGVAPGCFRVGFAPAASLACSFTGVSGDAGVGVSVARGLWGSLGAASDEEAMASSC
ncbi:hypothetical protein HG530_009764 [Fusarium avenaceum]|nr:hypothetical protein HG530_009764 [Fusarium avenaceum]